MRRILILDTDHEPRELLVEALRRTADVEIVLAADGDDIVAKVTSEPVAGVFADVSLLDGRTEPMMSAIRSAPARPLVILASNDNIETLDPDLISLIVRKPYDYRLVTGILLAAVLETPPGAGSEAAGMDAGQ